MLCYYGVQLRGDKKSIVNKIVLESAVTCLIWPTVQSHYVFGLADGKVTQTIMNINYCNYFTGTYSRS